ncbi:MAG: PEGA domain-containing protein, partial [Candidatus Delongbacteria bacterium]|nr:PEGA domain-containing protein [Candidatus Delongbacteria bacterium]
MKRLLFFAMMFLTALTFSAQFEIAKDVTELSGDITAAKYPYKDVNGQWCAILKVHTDVKDMQFEGFGYEKHDYRGEGIYLVYLQPETKSLKFKKDGYIAKSHTFPFKVKSNTVYQIDIKSIGEEKKIEDIAITVQSDPPGSEIFLDGVKKGRTEQVKTSVGKHEIRFEMPGYRPKTVSVEVAAGQTLFKEKLEKISEVSVEIHTVPEGASVYLDGIKIGVTPFATFYPEGEYSLRIFKENFEEINEKV